MVEPARGTKFERLDRRTTLTEVRSAGRHARRPHLRLGVFAAAPALCLLVGPLPASAQEVSVSTTVAAVGSGTAPSMVNLTAAQPKPATDRGLALPSLILIDDGSGLRVTNMVMELPELGLAGVAVDSRLGDQPLPAVFRAGQLAGSALASPIRGLTFTTTGIAPLSLSFGEMEAKPATGATAPGSPALAAAAMSFAPSARFSMTPQMLMPVGAPGAPTTVGTAIQTNVAGPLSLLTDVGMAGSSGTAWAPLASARLVGQWPRAGIETSVLRGAAPPQTGSDPGLVSSQDREAVRAQVQPLPGLTLVAHTSSARPAARPDADDIVSGSLRLAYDGLAAGQLATSRQSETTAARESAQTSLEWRQRGLGRMAVRYVQHRASSSAAQGRTESSSRVELELPALGPRCTGCPDLRAAVTAGSSSLTGPGVKSKVSGRVALVDNAALTGETELGVTGSDGQVLRALRLTTEMPVVPSARLQLSYSYRAGARVGFGQVFEARILRRLRVGW